MTRDLDQWIQLMTTLCQPDRIHYCDGSEEEYQSLCRLLVDKGTFIPLNQNLRPNSFLCRSDPADVARVEACTFICSNTPEEAGPTNNWRDPKEMLATLKKLFTGSMKGRTMYVVPFTMGPEDSPYARHGIELTDSPYVVCNMKLMTHMGKKALEKIRQGCHWVPSLHSVGRPLRPSEKDVVWPCREEKYIVHFPETSEIWSFGSGYGGNALLGKKCFALRIATNLAHREGWLAEHMLILGITNPEGEKRYFVAAFPSACGKTNLAMLRPTLPGWKIETVGDDIAWMNFDGHGQLRAINPETGFFGVAPGTSMESNPNAIATISHDTIFTNVALTDDGDVWWEGLTAKPPEHLIDWQGNDWTPQSTTKAAHPNSRFTVSAAQCPCIDPLWQSPQGVPISAIIFGGRRASVVPLVTEASSWQHGVFLGASVSSEMTAAATGTVGELRHDPFAMLPFCGYNMGDYFAHWLKLGKQHAAFLPRIYFVNWFRKGKDGQYLWPGYCENSRVLKWIFERTQGIGEAAESPIGWLPDLSSFDLSGLKLSAEAEKELFSVDPVAWIQEVESLTSYFSRFGEHLPPAFKAETERLLDHLQIQI